MANEKLQQWTVVKQIAVDADTAEEAVAKSDKGKTLALSANPRVQQPAQPPLHAPQQSQPEQRNTVGATAARVTEKQQARRVKDVK